MVHRWSRSGSQDTVSHDISMRSGPEQAKQLADPRPAGSTDLVDAVVRNIFHTKHILKFSLNSFKENVSLSSSGFTTNSRETVRGRGARNEAGERDGMLRGWISNTRKCDPDEYDCIHRFSFFSTAATRRILPANDESTSLSLVVVWYFLSLTKSVLSPWNLINILLICSSNRGKKLKPTADSIMFSVRIIRKC